MCDNLAGAAKTLWIIKNNECCNEVDDDGLVDGDKFLSLQWLMWKFESYMIDRWVSQKVNFYN